MDQLIITCCSSSSLCFTNASGLLCSALRDDEICCACLRLGVGCATIQSSCENFPSSLLVCVRLTPLWVNKRFGAVLRNEIRDSSQPQCVSQSLGHQDPRHRWQTKLCRWAPRLRGGRILSIWMHRSILLRKERVKTVPTNDADDDRRGEAQED
jgi:hypothetical protein